MSTVIKMFLILIKFFKIIIIQFLGIEYIPKVAFQMIGGEDINHLSHSALFMTHIRYNVINNNNLIVIGS